MSPLRPAVWFCIAGLLLSCGHDATTRSFCYWERTFRITPETKVILQKTDVNHLYVRYFDVDWDETRQEPEPVGTLIVASAPPCNFTPSVFITNKVFENVSHAAIDTLAARIVRRVEMVNRQFITVAQQDSVRGNRQATSAVRNWNEILFDCDWTVSTRDRYFYFLRKMEEYFPTKERSATLRLWQFRHRDMSGIPPVNRCLLMCYNLSDPKKQTTTNSIGSVQELESYLTQSNYPHHLDVALPLFGWGVVFHRGQWVGLLSGANAAKIRNNHLSFKEMEHNRFKIIRDTVIGKYYMRYGDEIRMEEIGAQELSDMVDLIKKRVSLRNSSRLTLFSLDPQDVNRYGTQEINTLFNTFSR